jgi:hypothetical protein
MRSSKSIVELFVSNKQQGGGAECGDPGRVLNLQANHGERSNSKAIGCHQSSRFRADDCRNVYSAQGMGARGRL